MSSRDGTVVLYHDLRDTLLAKSLDAMADRSGTQETKHAIARAVTFGSMAFSMLAQDTYKKIIFDMNRATSFDGETGAYIQYTYARCQSIIRKYDARDENTKILADTVASV